MNRDIYKLLLCYYVMCLYRKIWEQQHNLVYPPGVHELLQVYSMETKIFIMVVQCKLCKLTRFMLIRSLILNIQYYYLLSYVNT